jgi:ferredoxin
MLTLHDYSEADLATLRAFASECKYLGLCKEICPTTDRPHVHVVVQLTRQKRASVLQKLCAPKVIDTKFPTPRS